MARIGIPREIKPMEGRVALVPAACAELIRHGHELFVETGAGEASGYGDGEYARFGVSIVSAAADLYGAAQLIVKVKEPVGAEIDLLRPDHLLFSFLHLAADRPLAERLLAIGLTAVAFETVCDDRGGLPLLAPMSDIAGRVAVQTGVHLLHSPQGGRGILAGGLPGAPRGRAVVLGAGTAGLAAVTVAAALGMEVTAFDLQRERLTAARGVGANVTALHPYPHDIETAVASADLLVGAVLVPGRRPPRLVPREWVAQMAPRSVVVDIAVDQGGCIGTTRPMTHEDRPYVEAGALHWCVTNMPGGVPRTASQALSAALLPFVRRLASPGWEEEGGLAEGVNVRGGRYVNEAVRAELS